MSAQPARVPPNEPASVAEELTSPPPAAPPPRRRRLRAAWWVPGLLVVAVVGGVAYGEYRAWPWLSAPAERFLSNSLHRQVSFGEAPSQAQARVRLLGGIRIWADQLRIGSPEWSKAPFMVMADGAYLQLAYHDLWRAYRGKPVLVEQLRARQLTAWLERTADNRASWQFGPPRQEKPEAKSLLDGLHFDVLELAQGQINYKDAPLALDSRTEVSLSVRDARRAGPLKDGEVPEGVRARSQGSYQRFPLRAALTSGQLAPWLLGGEGRMAWPIDFHLNVGQARVDFTGSVDQLSAEADVLGNFQAKGPSLAAMGEPLGVTLPTTGAFAMRGAVRHQGLRTSVVVKGAEIGSSRLRGEFVYDRRPEVPMLAGRLGGTRLALADLGPAIGVPTSGQPASSRKEDARVLPDRHFDLPSLAMMNANVLIDIAQLDLSSEVLEPLQPLKGHLVLDSSVLTISDLQARTAQGELTGRLALDGTQKNKALWNADLAVNNVVIENWIKALKPEGRAPYLTGRVTGRAMVKGEGQSTAAILGSLTGPVQVRLRDGTISHLAVEGAGIDVAQVLGVLIRGDDSLAVPCARADIKAFNGTLTPELFVINTKDSSVWVQGSLSLKDERMALQARVAPKDFSVLTLRTPVQVNGPLNDPHVSIKASALLPRVAGAVALGFLNPVAAIVPLIDPGNKDIARQADQACDAGQ
ncbi:MAG TPA: AsmA family protein [Candidatus Aquabacterium excrementipullorum]|nr:AsmA family protein [Candidatus Aquabacterium excrementipullorum]